LTDGEAPLLVGDAMAEATEADGERATEGL
jgi:hypothetical protein